MRVDRIDLLISNWSANKTCIFVTVQFRPFTTEAHFIYVGKWKEATLLKGIGGYTTWNHGRELSIGESEIITELCKAQEPLGSVLRSQL